MVSITGRLLVSTPDRRARRNSAPEGVTEGVQTGKEGVREGSGRGLGGVWKGFRGGRGASKVLGGRQGLNTFRSTEGLGRGSGGGSGGDLSIKSRRP
eukprot:349251-Prorocentrum_minimum.AAC.1